MIRQWSYASARPEQQSVMMERPVTPSSYLAEMAAMSWRHGGELTVALSGAIVLAIVGFLTLGSYAPFIVTTAIVALLLFEGTTAAWRLHRRQSVALATTRSLLDLNAGDRAELEHHLRARYRRREARIQERNADRLERLTGEIATLRTEIVDRSHRKAAM